MIQRIEDDRIPWASLAWLASIFRVAVSKFLFFLIISISPAPLFHLFYSSYTQSTKLHQPNHTVAPLPLTHGPAVQELDVVESDDSEMKSPNNADADDYADEDEDDDDDDDEDSEDDNDDDDEDKKVDDDDDGDDVGTSDSPNMPDRDSPAESPDRIAL